MQKIFLVVLSITSALTVIAQVPVHEQRLVVDPQWQADIITSNYRDNLNLHVYLPENGVHGPALIFVLGFADTTMEKYSIPKLSEMQSYRDWANFSAFNGVKGSCMKP